MISQRADKNSFLHTVQSVQTKTLSDYATQKSVAVQGFPHAMLFVSLCSCPILISHSQKGPEEMLEAVLSTNLSFDVASPVTRDQDGTAVVKSLLVENRWEDSLGFEDSFDSTVEAMVDAIAERHKFGKNSWSGGITFAKAINDDHGEEEEGEEVSLNPVRNQRGAKLSLQSLKESFEEKFGELKYELEGLKEERRELKDEIREQMDEIDIQKEHIKVLQKERYQGSPSLPSPNRTTATADTTPHETTE